MPSLPYVAPRLSATVALLRPAAGGRPEVLLLRRHGRSGFAAEAWVFPGGTVDAADRELPPSCWRGIDPPALAARFRVPASDVLGLHVAAARETFEEAGVLLGARADGTVVDAWAPGVVAVRRRLAARDSEAGAFHAWLAEARVVLHLDALGYWSRWVTPRIEPRRYDTCFFVAQIPAAQRAESDRVETTGHRWMTAQAALDAAAGGDLHLIYPTLRNLEALAHYEHVGAVLAAAAAQEDVPTVLPHFEAGPNGRVLHPDHPDFPHDWYREELGPTKQQGRP